MSSWIISQFICSTSFNEFLTNSFYPTSSLIEFDGDTFWIEAATFDDLTCRNCEILSLMIRYPRREKRSYLFAVYNKSKIKNLPCNKNGIVRSSFFMRSENAAVSDKNEVIIWGNLLWRLLYTCFMLLRLDCSFLCIDKDLQFA